MNYYSAKTLASKIGRKYRDILDEIRNGMLVATKVGGTYVISDEDLKLYKRGRLINEPRRSVFCLVFQKNKLLLVYSAGNWVLPHGNIKKGADCFIGAEYVCLDKTGIHCKGEDLLKRFQDKKENITKFFVRCNYVFGNGKSVKHLENVLYSWFKRSDYKKILDSEVLDVIDTYV